MNLDNNTEVKPSVSPETHRTEHTAVEVGLFDQNKDRVVEEVETKWSFKAPTVERKSVYSTVNKQISFKPGQPELSPEVLKAFSKPNYSPAKSSPQ